MIFAPNLKKISIFLINKSVNYFLIIKACTRSNLIEGKKLSSYKKFKTFPFSNVILGEFPNIRRARVNKIQSFCFTCYMRNNTQARMKCFHTPSNEHMGDTGGAPTASLSFFPHLPIYRFHLCADTPNRGEMQTDQLVQEKRTHKHGTRFS